MPHLLSIDVGIRTGFSLFDKQGKLLWYRSQNFGNAQRLKRGIYGILNEIEELELVYLEGGGRIGKIWAKELKRRGIPYRIIQAHHWRELFFHQKEYPSGEVAKSHAIEMAYRIIEHSDVKKTKSMMHDAAESILAGAYGLLDSGWLTKLPYPLR